MERTSIRMADRRSEALVWLLAFAASVALAAVVVGDEDRRAGPEARGLTAAGPVARGGVTPGERFAHR